MAATPKRKSSKARSLKRRSRDNLKFPQLVIEKSTGEKVLPHRVSKLGVYKGKKISEAK